MVNLILLLLILSTIADVHLASYQQSETTTCLEEKIVRKRGLFDIFHKEEEEEEEEEHEEHEEEHEEESEEKKKDWFEWFHKKKKKKHKKEKKEKKEYHTVYLPTPVEKHIPVPVQKPYPVPLPIYEQKKVYYKEYIPIPYIYKSHEKRNAKAAIPVYEAPEALSGSTVSSNNAGSLHSIRFGDIGTQNNGNSGGAGIGTGNFGDFTAQNTGQFDNLGATANDNSAGNFASFTDISAQGNNQGNGQGIGQNGVASFNSGVDFGQISRNSFPSTGSGSQSFGSNQNSNGNLLTSNQAFNQATFPANQSNRFRQQANGPVSFPNSQPQRNIPQIPPAGW